MPPTESEDPHEKEKEFQQILEALRLFREQNGHLRIPKSFKVPTISDWPKPLWEVRLAKKIYHLRFWHRFVVGSPQRRNQLDALGYLWPRLQDEYNLILEALVIFKSIHGHLLVPSKFVVPCEKDWPEHLWDMALGTKVNQIRVRHDFITNHPSRWLQLHEMGFVWNCDDRSFALTTLAFKQFRDIYGHTQVPVQFVVPHSEMWATEIRGLKLGEKVRKIKQGVLFIKSKPQRIESLEKVGFEWTSRSESKFSNFMQALKVYKVIYKHINISSAFVVPNEQPWPKESWGMPLGQRLALIKSQRLYVKNNKVRKKAMQAIGVSQ